ncbi:MAG: adenylate/guanylate cyclase domain-containing protein, partial [Acidimicrobiia bacterium]
MPVEKGQNFCANCGHNLKTGEGSTALAPSRYTPAHLAERILTERDTVVGERKLVTVMFADIVDSTRAIEGADPEVAAEFLTSALDGMMFSIHQYEGTVNELRGDGLMALFGAPIAHEDHAVRAAMAALAIPDAVSGATSDSARTRVGLHTGEVLVRGVGNDLSVEYQALGPTVHLAARMESLAEPGTTFVTKEVQSLVEGHIRTHHVGRLTVQGISDLVDVYKLDSASTDSQWEVRARRGLTEFSGRALELASLKTARERAVLGRGRTVGLSGEAGVGKSRLVHEFLETLDEEEVSVLQADASPFETNTAYYPIKTLISGWIAELASDGTDYTALESALRAIDEALVDSAPAISALIGIENHDPGWSALSPQERRRSTRNAIKSAVSALARRKPLVVIVEDLHWVDSETEGVIEEIVAMTSELPLLTILTFRPEFAPNWGRAAHINITHLEALNDSESQNILTGLMGSDPSISHLKTLVAERAEGTPLFLEETVRALADSGAIEGTKGAYRVARPESEIDIPETVTAVLAAR